MGFGVVPSAGENFGVNGFSSSSGLPSFDAPASYEAKPSNGLNALTQNTARFAETVRVKADMTDTVFWSFTQCLLFMLQGLIPIYGLIIHIMCAMGNPRKYPTQVTNYVRAGLVFSVFLVLVMTILTMVLGSGIFSVLKSYGG